MKSEYFNDKKIIYPEINIEQFESLHEVFDNYKGRKTIILKKFLSIFLIYLLSFIYYIVFYGLSFCYIVNSYEKLINNKNLILFLPSFLLLAFLISVISTGLHYDITMFYFIRDIINNLFKINIIKDLDNCLNKTINTLKNLYILKNSKKEDIKNFEYKHIENYLSFDIKGEELHIENSYLCKNLDDNKEVFDFSYLDKEYEKCMNQLKKLDKKYFI